MKRKNRGFVVTLDGPSGAGKSTVSKLLADSLGGLLMDTGAMYRAVALLSLESGLERPSAWANLARRLSFDVDVKSGVILVNDANLGDRLRGEQVSSMASRISQFTSVRKVLTGRQRTLGNRLSKRHPVVVEGRDIGTVVFPNSRFKFFVTAQPKVRADRRYRQLKAKGVKGISVASILREINRRDRQDSIRKVAPLRCPEDAVIVDTSKMPIPQVVLFLKNHIESKLLSV
ncbi:MAG: (d)CMP kinase [Deltaproteobacteria bacterium]|nr:(d)CMP kinase [Deltaproteobacteria bacterium]MBI3293812.1 (d)CMP kinase [Deltaproteobacteria bacterium]